MQLDNINNKEIYEYLKRNSDCCYVNEIYLMIINNDFLRMSSQRMGFIGVYTIFFLTIALSGVLQFFNLIYERKVDYNNEIAIARVAREKSKIANVKRGIQFIGDDIKNRDFTMYRIGSRYDRLLFLSNSYIKCCMSEFKRIKEILNNEQLIPFMPKVLLWCVKRIPHTVIFKSAVKNIISKYNLSTIYIGATHERFSLIVEELSKRNKKRLICIPHGIETTEKMPGGYVGDIFYCSSSEMAIKLNQLYQTSKFIFEENITMQMYRIVNRHQDSEWEKTKKVVFFTQPVHIEATKKSMHYIAKYLESQKQKLYIKVHPLEKSSDYIIENTEMINELEKAIVGNICISLCSTVLMEAIYNESLSISIIHLVNGVIDLTGSNAFLNERRILKPENEIALLEIIDQFI